MEMLSDILTLLFQFCDFFFNEGLFGLALWFFSVWSRMSPLHTLLPFRETEEL